MVPVSSRHESTREDPMTTTLSPCINLRGTAREAPWSDHFEMCRDAWGVG